MLTGRGFPKGSLSVDPVIGGSMKMHCRLDDNLIWINAVDKSIGKAMHKTAADMMVDKGPSFWVHCNILNSRIDFVEKRITETGCL